MGTRSRLSLFQGTRAAFYFPYRLAAEISLGLLFGAFFGCGKGADDLGTQAVYGRDAIARFAVTHPGSARVLSVDGQRLVHASGFLAPTGARGPAEAARAFLADQSQGTMFGVTARQALTVRSSAPVGSVGAVRFERTIDGLPVFGGDLVLGVDAQNRVFVVNGGDVPPDVSGRHDLDAAAAQAAALSSFGPRLRGERVISVAPGWETFGRVLRAVYQVDFIAEDPPGDWRVVIDGETGRALFSDDLRVSASGQGSVFEISPVETATAFCPASGNGHSFCAAPIAVTLPNLVTGSDLTGTQTTVYNCKGADHPSSAAEFPGACAPVPAVNGTFMFPVDSTFQSTADDFAAAMAYYHLDKHVSFLRGLDPSLPPGPGRAVRASLPGVVNSHESGAPFENAIFAPFLDAMVFGQGAAADFAYDATVAYHEFTHGVVFAWGNFSPRVDSLGTIWEASAVNEGTADSLAVSETGRSQIGSFLAATGFPPGSPPGPFLRDLNDPNVTRSCQGDGTVLSRAGIPGVNGLDGEEHDDGEIWNGFYWEVYQGLKAASIRACGGRCDAGPAIQYKAVQLAAGTGPALGTYWQTVKAAAGALFPSQPNIAAYVDCVARRRRLDKCDRTFPVYAGESKVQIVQGRFSPFQIMLQASGPIQFSICSTRGSATTLYVRNGSPAEITGTDPATGNAIVTADGSASFSQSCSTGSTPFTINSAGTWHVLLDSPSSLPPALDVYDVAVDPTNMLTRPAVPAAPTCSLPFSLLIVPATASTPPKGTIPFGPSGGSGAGFTWSLASNNSGATVNSATGVYTAGPVPNVTDVVQLSDSLGDTTTRTVTVSAGLSISPATATTPPQKSVTFSAAGGSDNGFTWILATNASGASINASNGVYNAGSKGGVTDVVQVADSLGNTATASVTVTASPPPTSSGGGGCSTGSGVDFAWAAIGVGVLARRRKRKGEEAR